MTQTCLSWGRFPYYPQSVRLLYWCNEVQPILKSYLTKQKTTLAFGNGRSYGDSCLSVSDMVLQTTNLDRFIAADWDQGLIMAEAGVTLKDILALAIPQGWFLPVTPGTMFVTLGGAIANDVHGKNHHVRGTFGCYVKKFNLVRSDQEPMICSRQDHPHYFAATIGGLGLTGIITWAELQLMPIKSSQINLNQFRFNNLKEFFKLSAELDQCHEYSVAWIDCLAKGKSRGRGIYTVGDHAKTGPLDVSTKRKFTVPFTTPFSFVNSLSLKFFNTLYYQLHSKTGADQVVDYEKFFYPLDKILAWNKMYGPKGFQQYQCVIPDKHAEEGIDHILKVISKMGTGSFLAVLKRCGNIPSPGLLSFPLPGTSLALDFPENHARNSKLFTYLNAIVHEAGGRLYPAKDAQMTEDHFRKAYPQWKMLENLRDPAILSRFWRRVSQ
jgi:FAD/FMN-containing dehydrogenase